MLIRFRVENFRSIRDEQELSLVASPLSEHTETLVHADRYEIDLLRTAAIYGPNASGKSTVFLALEFMQAAVEDSHRIWAPDRGVPRTPFALDPAAAAEPSLFAVDLLLDGVRYEYGFVVDSTHVHEEWLYAYPNGRKQEWFTRDASRAPEFTFSRNLKGENRTIARFTRPNSLFLSVAARNNHPMLDRVYAWFGSGLFMVSESSRAHLDLAGFSICQNEQLGSDLLRILELADLGISGLEVVEGDMSAYASRLGLKAADPELPVPPFSPRPATTVRLRHRAGAGEDVALPFEQESQGTQTLFAMAGIIMAVLGTGGVMVVDELDRSLHTHLALSIIRMFTNPETNPNNAQLIFNTHDTNLLDTSILRRDQIWFTEKGQDGATRLFPLTDFRARKHENLERGYLQGRYGAVPAIGEPNLGLTAGD
ncbi:AAA family ATPase [Longimicrobium terrae]|uniref:ATPase AAA-type core domain-containing protein n=1 Tax=Longimicrobium terrae TaxID=1639882 RepID=A0A841H770_9BACT|nr:hypothetical protein [Longimicrobium terrae]MBB6073696.1 hypothetical protein [Longimicrobium terrae]NNC30641.1 AAA family ATPase [Longimicrobium terrae]